MMQGAIVLVQVSGGADLNAVHKDLHGVENVKEVFVLAGPTDALCHVEAADVDTLVRTVQKVRAVKGVASTDTRFIVPLH
jgi:hypothetical protein